MGKVLVLCIDRDDDLGRKTGIKGPVIGAEANIKAATAMLEADPGESDGNAMFEAVRTFRELKKDAVDVVTLTGHGSRGYKADKIIAEQLDEVLKSYPKLEGVFLVTDGADDDQLIPIIQSKTKIVSKSTLIIKQAKELEKSYYVIKQLLQEPGFARIVFGLPGIILLTYSFLQDLGIRIILLLIGAYLLLKGFGIEEQLLNSVRNFRETTSIDRISFPVYIGSLLMGGLALWAGIEKLSATETNAIIQSASFLSGFINLFVIALGLFFVGRIGDMIYRKEEYRIKRYMMSFVSIIVVWFVILQGIDFVLGRIFVDEFLLWAVMAFLGSLAGYSLVKTIYNNYFIEQKLKKDVEVYNEKAELVGKVSEVNLKREYINVQPTNEKDDKIKFPLKKIALVRSDFVTVRTK